MADSVEVALPSVDCAGEEHTAAAEVAPLGGTETPVDDRAVPCKGKESHTRDAHVGRIEGKHVPF